MVSVSGTSPAELCSKTSLRINSNEYGLLQIQNPGYYSSCFIVTGPRGEVMSGNFEYGCLAPSTWRVCINPALIDPTLGLLIAVLKTYSEKQSRNNNGSA